MNNWYNNNKTSNGYVDRSNKGNKNTIEKGRKKNKFTNIYKEQKKLMKILKQKCPEGISVGVTLLI